MQYRILLGIALLGLWGCGDGDSPADACRSAAEALCGAACACTQGAECALVDSTGGGVTTITFDSQTDCELLFSLGCGTPEAATFDFAACEAAVGQASCVDDGDGGQGLPNLQACVVED